jgi:hypothetical protein
MDYGKELLKLVEDIIYANWEEKQINSVSIFETDSNISKHRKKNSKL